MLEMKSGKGILRDHFMMMAFNDPDTAHAVEEKDLKRGISNYVIEYSTDGVPRPVIVPLFVQGRLGKERLEQACDLMVEFQYTDYTGEPCADVLADPLVALNITLPNESERPAPYHGLRVGR